MAKETQAATNEADLYNFEDLTDLPEALAAKLAVSSVSNENVERYAAIVANAPRKLSIAQVRAVAIRKFGEAAVPTEQTIRGYLNDAREQGLIGKPSRQFYWTAESDVADEDQETAEAASAEEDVLSGL